MKRIIATVREKMANDVIFALHQVKDFPGATMCEVRGIGEGFHHHDDSPAVNPSFEYPTFIRFEITCADSLVTAIIATITDNARTGHPNDGKIDVLSTTESINIAPTAVQ